MKNMKNKCFDIATAKRDAPGPLEYPTWFLIVSLVLVIAGIVTIILIW